jgi:predicted HTH domain antitoxin
VKEIDLLPASPIGTWTVFRFRRHGIIQAKHVGNEGFAVTVSFDLPNEVEQQLRGSLGDLGEAAKHALLISAYRQGRISIGRIAAILGLGIVATQQWLLDHDVPINYSEKEFADDCATLDRLYPNG